MRWDNLLEQADERARLPGYRDDAVVRHFEAPDGIQTRFYEVRAKSIFNRVPAASADAVQVDDQPLSRLYRTPAVTAAGAAHQS